MFDSRRGGAPMLDPMRRKLSLGVQDFASIREDGLLDVDKIARLMGAEYLTMSGSTLNSSMSTRSPA
jgi:hypothetical protein